MPFVETLYIKAFILFLKCNDVHNKLVVKHSKFNSVNILEAAQKKQSLTKRCLVLVTAHRTCYKKNQFECLTRDREICTNEEREGRETESE